MPRRYAPPPPPPPPPPQPPRPPHPPAQRRQPSPHRRARPPTQPLPAATIGLALVDVREQRGRLGGDAQRHYELEAEVSRRPLNALTSLLVLSRDAWESPLVGLLAEEIVK